MRVDPVQYPGDALILGDAEVHGLDVHRGQAARGRERGGVQDADYIRAVLDDVGAATYVRSQQVVNKGRYEFRGSLDAGDYGSDVVWRLVDLAEEVDLLEVCFIRVSPDGPVRLGRDLFLVEELFQEHVDPGC